MRNPTLGSRIKMVDAGLSLFNMAPGESTPTAARKKHKPHNSEIVMPVKAFYRPVSNFPLPFMPASIKRCALKMSDNHRPFHRQW
jgi:hypothetical protein